MPYIISISPFLLKGVTSQRGKAEKSHSREAFYSKKDSPLWEVLAVGLWNNKENVPKPNLV